MLTITRPIVCFDIEGTGLDVAKDRIVSIALKKIHPVEAPATLHILMNPGIPIPPEATEIHGITDEMVRDLNPFGTHATTIHSFITGCDLIGYNLRNYDVPMLWEEFDRCDIEWNLAGVNIIDASAIFKKKETRDLTAALKFYCNKVHDKAHDALSDVEATVQVLEGQQIRYDDIGAMSVEQLAEFSKMDQRVDLAGKIVLDKDGDPSYAIGKSKGVKVKDDTSFAQWMLSRDFTSQTKAVLRKILEDICNAHSPAMELFK